MQAGCLRMMVGGKGELSGCSAATSAQARRPKVDYTSHCVAIE